MRTLGLRNEGVTGQRPLIVAFAVLASVIASLVVGVLAGSGSFLSAGIIAVAGFALVAAFSPSTVLWGVFALGFVVAGLARLYVPELQQVRWLLLPATCVLAGHALLIAVRHEGIRFPAFVWLGFGFIAIIVASTLANESMNSTALLGLKGYFQLWGVILAFALIPWAMSTENSMLTAFLIILISGLGALWRKEIISAPIFFASTFTCLSHCSCCRVAISLSAQNDLC